MITLLTATGCRPEAWALCERMMLAQTYRGPVNWIIVDDGVRPQPITFEREGWTLTVVRPTPPWQPGQNTQARNLMAGLEVVEPDAKLLVIEDDDFYAKDWLQVASGHLEAAELVGETCARYYNVRTRTAKQLRNSQHASLCATAMRGKAIDMFAHLCHANVKFIDVALWSAAQSKMLFTGHRVVGIKGLPGREGIGMGHRSDLEGIKDRDGSILREWIGADAVAYQR